MNIFSCMKKRLTVFALAMAMFASVLCGVLFIGARAEAFTASSLITAGAGVTVTQGDADAKYTMADGTQVSNPGLFIETAAANSAGVGFSLNGIFTGSLGLEMWSPGEGFYGVNKGIAITVASVADPDTSFQVYIQGTQGQTGYVVYNHNGTSLYRTQEFTDRTTVPDEAERKYYYEQSVCTAYTGAFILPYYSNYSDGNNRYRKVEDSVFSDYKPQINIGYFGIHKSAIDGSEDYRYDVVLNHGYGGHMVVASFATPEAEFEAKTTGDGMGDSNLPVLDLDAGYTVSFNVWDEKDDDSINLLFPTMAVSDTGDPYTGTDNNKTRYDLSGEFEAPAFYTAWQEAEWLNDTDLLTVSGGASAEAAKQYTMQNASKDGTIQAGEKVGPAGLYVNAPSNSVTYSFDINGVFTGSSAMKFALPGEGFWPEGVGGPWNNSGWDRYIVFTVASVSDPDEKFQVTLHGLYQSAGYLTFEWEGQTIYRTKRTSSDGDKYFLYSETDAIDTNKSQWLPNAGNWQNSSQIGSALFALQMETDGTLNVVMETEHGAGRRTAVMASFSSNPDSYANPLTTGEGEDCNLPKLESFKNGYTISVDITVDARDQDKIFDFVMESIATSETGDPYALGRVYRFDGSVKNTVPDFYTRWQNVPVITVADDEFDAVQPVNEEITLPEATYTTRVNDVPQPVTDISYKFGDAGWQPATAGKFTPDQAGVYTVRYLVDGVYSAQIEITVRDDVTFADTQLEKLVRVSDNATAEANAQYIVGSDPKKTDDTLAPEEVGTPIGDPGLLVTPNNFEALDPYTVDLVGVFEGNTAIEWSVPGENWSNASEVIFTIADVADPSNSFQVIWTGANQSPAYVRYNYPGRDGVPAQQLLRVSNGSDTSYAMYDGTRPGEGADETQFGRIGDNYFAKFKPYKGAWNTVSERTPGLLSLEWTEDGALNIVALNDMGSRTVMASFCEEPETFVPVDTETTKTQKGLDYNLPKLTFEHGYTISVEVTSNAMFMLFDVTTGGETTSFAAERQNYEPAFYTQGKQIPVFGDVQSIADVVLGTEVNVPALGYKTYGGTKGTVSDIKWGPVSGDMTAVTAGNKFTVTGEGGDYVVRYTVTALGVDFVKEVTFHACNYTTPGTVIEEATCTTDGEGWFSCVHDHSIVKTIPATAHAKMEAHEAQAATCGEAGNKAYWYCPDCGKYFSDAQGNSETSLADVTIPAIAHKNLETNVYQAPTCTEEGNEAYWYCPDCKQYFTDASAETTTTLEEVTIPAKGHTYGNPTWEWDGVTKATATFTCTNDCGHEETIVAEDDAITSAVTTPATCTTEGVRTYTATVTLGEQQYKGTTTEKIDPTGHDATLVHVEGKAATCLEAGVKEHYKCDSCGATFEDADGEKAMAEVTIPATGHNMQKVEAVAPTCEAGGNSEYYECSVCHKQFKDAAGKTETTAEKCALKPLGHNVKKVEGKAATCTEDGNSGYYKCENCGACYSDSKGEMNIDESSMILKATGHKYENGVCTVCGAADPAAAEDEGGCGSAVSVAGVSVLLAGAVLAAAGGLFLGRKKRS